MTKTIKTEKDLILYTIGLLNYISEPNESPNSILDKYIKSINFGTGKLICSHCDKEVKFIPIVNNMHPECYNLYY